jgi:hypothetical protein
VNSRATTENAASALIEAERHKPAANGDADIVAEFGRLAARLDAAGLGPADYLYAPLKWRLQNRDAGPAPFSDSVLKSLRLIAEPPALPPMAGPAAILAASSYAVSAGFLKKVVETFAPTEAAFSDGRAASQRSAIEQARDQFRALRAFIPAAIFAARVSAVLHNAGVPLVLRRRIAEAAFKHAIYRRTARAVLRAAKPECLVIANGNRPFEFALFAEAKARRVATVLLPFAELNPKPARFLSLCRGAFDLSLPFSEYSASELRNLRAGARIEVVGFPSEVPAEDDEASPGEERRREILYVCGNNFEEEAASIMREAFAGARDARLRVRLHPRNDAVATRALYDFVPDGNISDPNATPISEDIANADLAIMMRSTVALEAMFAGKPVVWLSPPACLADLADHPIRKQELALFDADAPAALREAVLKLADDRAERERVAKEQWRRLRAAGYDQDYYEAVRSALRRLVDWGSLQQAQRRDAADSLVRDLAKPVQGSR